MFNVTKKAQDAIKSFNTEKKPFVRVAVEAGGCVGLKYKMLFENEKKEHDTLIPFDGLNIIQDFKSGLFLESVTIDYENTLNSSGFIYVNSRAASVCGCKESFSV